MQTDGGPLPGKRRSRGAALIGVAPLLALIVGTAGAVSTYNGLATGREAVVAAWSQVEVVLQRRSDLVPRLLAVAEAHAAHEREMAARLVEARAAYEGSRWPGRVEDGRELERAVAAARAVLEAQPGVGSAAGWDALRREVVGTENRIAIERRRYNAAVQLQRSRLRAIPGRLLAPMLGFTDPPEY